MAVETASRDRLPEYDKPPVTEVVLGVQFRELEGLRTAHTGLYWQTIRKDYPQILDQVPLSPVLELFDEPVPPGPSVRFAPLPPLRRCWFLDASGNRLVQVQPERFLHNWRKVTGSEEYPRYSSIGKEFERLWRGFLDFVKTEKIGDVVPNQWEMTYVNHIYQGEDWETLADLPKLFACWSGSTSSGYLEVPETTDVRLSFVFPKEHGRLHARWNVRFQPAENRKLLRLEMTARGKLDSAEPEDLLRCLDMGHRWIVLGFTDLTTDTAHKLWRRTDA
jgi:uncharacterized protein (TIGR04255 family)